MRTLLRSAAGVLASLALLIAGEGTSQLLPLQFADGRARAFTDVEGQTLVLVYFCGHCPGAAARLKDGIKPLHDRIEQERLPARLVLITPDKEPAELVRWQKSQGFTGAWVAHDPVNPMGIGLSNIWQVRMLRDGQPLRGEVAAALSGGRHRLSDEGIADARVKTVWWMVERGAAGAGAALAQGLAAPAAKAECTRLLERLRARRDALTAATAPATIGTYDRLAELAADWAGLPAAELAPIQQRLAELAKDKALADELAARQVWQRIQALLAGSPAQRKQGSEGFAELAKRYGATRYGQLAAAQAKGAGKAGGS